MKKFLLALFVALAGVSFVAADVQAKRLGGGGTSGMKRQTPPPQPAQPVPAKPAATPDTAAAGTGAAAAATPPKRSWLGPIAGIAAGLGLAALMSHLGLGAEFGNLLTMLLLVLLAVFVLRFLLRRFGPGAASRNTGLAAQGLQYAGAGAASVLLQRNDPSFGSGGSFQGASPTGLVASPAAVAGGLPAGFDAAAFERVAKLIFIRMQAANDAGNLEDLRQFATPEMFATFRLELQDRKGLAQQTDVVQLDAQVLDFAQEDERQIVSVRFHGLIREEKDAPAQPFDEVWHLAKPADGSREWAIAGIAQSEPA